MLTYLNYGIYLTQLPTLPSPALPPPLTHLSPQHLSKPQPVHLQFPRYRDTHLLHLLLRPDSVIRLDQRDQRQPKNILLPVSPATTAPFETHPPPF